MHRPVCASPSDGVSFRIVTGRLLALPKALAGQLVPRFRLRNHHLPLPQFPILQPDRQFALWV